MQYNCDQNSNFVCVCVCVKIKTFLWKCRRPSILRQPQKNKKKTSTGCTIPDIKTCCKATVIKAGELAQAQRDQCPRIESPQKVHAQYDTLYGKSTLQLRRVNSAGPVGYLHEKTYFDPLDIKLKLIN